MSSMGDRIREARVKKGLKQSQLAELIGAKSGGVISNWEQDINKPDADKIVRLCEVLEISASYLLDYYGDEKKPATGIGDGLSEQETKLMDLVRKLTPEQKKLLLAWMQTMREQGE